MRRRAKLMTRMIHCDVTAAKSAVEVPGSNSESRSRYPKQTCLEIFPMCRASCPVPVAVYFWVLILDPDIGGCELTAA